jgi:hypothetical protein
MEEPVPLHALDVEAEVGALSLLLGKLYALYFTMPGALPFEQFRQALISSLKAQALVRTSDPAISDVTSALVEERIMEFLEGVAKTLQSTGHEPPA